MGSNTSKPLQAMDIVKKNKIAIILAVIAFCASIVACLVSLYNSYTFYIHQQPHVNLASVPGSTNVSGNLQVTGDMCIQSWQEATSETEASFTTRGGIGVVGSIVSGNGMYSEHIDTQSNRNHTMKIGKKNHVGIEIGKREFPISIEANRFLIDAPKTQVQDLIPISPQCFDLGDSKLQWNNLYLSKDIINANGFATRAGTGGVYVMLENGPKLYGLSNSIDSILTLQEEEQNEEKQIESKEKYRSFQLHSLCSGDVFELNILGIIHIPKPNITDHQQQEENKRNLVFCFTLNGLHHSIPYCINNQNGHKNENDQQEQPPPEEYLTGRFRMSFIIYKRNTMLYVISKITCINQGEQECMITIPTETIPFLPHNRKDTGKNHNKNNNDKVRWDICVDRNKPGLGENGFLEVHFCEMHKIY